MARLGSHCDRHLEYNKKPQFCLRELEEIILDSLSGCLFFVRELPRNENIELETSSQHINSVQTVICPLNDACEEEPRSHEIAKLEGSRKN